MRLFTILCCALLGSACEVLDPQPGPEAYTAGGAGASNLPAPGGGGASGGGTNGGAVGGAANLLEGETLYIQYCGVCHGADGGGAGPFPGSIQGATEMFDIVYNGKGEMPAFAQLTRDDVLAMEAYLATFVSNREGPMTMVEVYATTCAGCHGSSGEGSDRGPHIRSPVRPFATHITRNGRRAIGYTDDMPAYNADEVSDEHLAEMWDWTHSFPRPTDGRGLWVRYCGNCHGPQGGGGHVRQSVLDEDLGDWIETTRDGEGGRGYGNREDYMPAWSRSEISDAEIRLMYDYIMGL